MDIAGMLIKGILQQKIHRSHHVPVVAFDLLLSPELEELLQVAEIYAAGGLSFRTNAVDIRVRQ